MPRLQIVVEKDLAEKVKRFAAKHRMTVSAAGAELLKEAVESRSIEARLAAVDEMARMNIPVEKKLKDMKRNYVIERLPE